MSEALYLALEEDIDLDSYVQIEATAKALNKIDRLAREIGVTALGQFVYGNEDDYADVAEHEGWAGSDYTGTGDGWHDAGDGLESVQSLIGYIESDPNCLKRPKATLTELRAVEAVLKDANQQGVRFRFELDE